MLQLARGREWQPGAIAITGLVALLAAGNALLLGWPLWGIALSLIVPCVPLFVAKVFWSSRHYGFMALFLVFVVLQLGHFAEHITQMLQFITVDNPAAGCLGWSWNGPGCPEAHGVFGALDRELVHFVWDGLVLVATAVIRWHFRRVKNIWLTLAVAAAGLHQVEHIFLFGMYLFNRSVYSNGGAVLSQALFICTIPEGAGVQAGLLGRNGVLGTLAGRDGALNALLPNRINLHFVYNTLVLLPMLLGFARQTRFIYDEWLAKALPRLSEQQLIAATARAENLHFPAGTVLFRQGDPADRLYVITKGRVEVLRRERGGIYEPVAQLGAGQFFGEIGLLGRTRRTAAVKALDEVECLALDREVVKAMLVTSADAYKELDLVLRRRLVQLGALEGLAIKAQVYADEQTVLKTRMIRDRLRLLESSASGQLLGLEGTDKHISGASPLGILLVRNGPAAGQWLPIDMPQVIVGRAGARGRSTPVLKLEDERVSRRHIEIRARRDGLYIRDLGSANGSWVDGRRLRDRPVRLRPGAEIRLGPQSVLRFQAPPIEAPPA
jgi:CRP-like cAMP-binding protein